MEIRSLGEDAYFAASNSARGFFSYYGECFDAPRIRRLYAVKGGPGTGKSRFLREVAQYGEKRGWRCEYVYCSSDPDSLDGIVLEKGDDCIALIDATSPHAYEPTHPGFREEIVNLGAFWNWHKLADSAERIEELNKQKGECYRRAYRYLSGVGDMVKTRDALVAPYVKRDAIRHLAGKLMQAVPNGEGFSSSPALIHSVGMRGEVGFDTYFAMAKHILRIEDCKGSAAYLMEALGEEAVRKGLKVRLSHDPILPDRLDGLFLCQSGVAFVVCPAEECSYPHRQVRMRRFVDVGGMKKIREDVNYAERVKRALLGGALDALEQVRRIHFEVEEIYATAMDFPAKEAFTKEFCASLLGM